jgi:NAD(P)-dependent dehydrogenase (short-subunit alcohol dehydrogenase family)
MQPSKSYGVTGAASGIGRATAQLLSRAAQVFALDVDEEGLAAVAAASPQVVAVRADLTRASSLEEAAALIASRTSGLDGLVNCAGLIRCGALVELPEEDLKAVLEVNVLGAYRATRALYPLLKARRGRVVNVSSEAARVTSPFNGAYSMSKYALEAYSDALRRELALEGMKVVIIQPGAVKTALLAGTVPSFDKAIAGSAFARGMQAIRDMADKEWAKGAEPLVVAEAIERALTHPHPAVRYRVGNDPFRRAAEFLPARWLDAALGFIMRR